MNQLEKAKKAFNEARERMNAAADRVEELLTAESVDENALVEARSAFDDAETETDERKQRVDELQRIADARARTPLAVNDDDEPTDDVEFRDADGNAVRSARGYYGDGNNKRAAGLGEAGYNFRRVDHSKTIVRVGHEALTYERGGEHSFVFDLQAARNGDTQARARLERHAKEMVVEKRAINETAGTGGEFVPPLWMQDQWIKLARAGRPFANAVNRRPLPPNTNSINFPSVTGGAATAAQADGGAVQSTDPTTSSLSVAVKTIAGQVDLARQLLDRSMPGMDEVLFDDLARDYATKLDVQALNGSGAGANAKGILNASGTLAITYTSGSPTAAGVYTAITQAISQVAYNRFLPPNLVVMHPRRWYWLLSSVDSQGRPLVTPSDVANFNTLALLDTVGAENLVGRISGLPVIIDSSIPTNMGASTNQDPVIVTRTDDVWLFEDEAPVMKVYEEVLSGNLQIRVQVYGYFAFTAERYGKATGIINGTGLTAPSGF